MDLNALLQALRRRWLILPLVLLPTIAVLVTMNSIAPSYRTTGSVLLVAPITEDSQNPLLGFSRSLDLTAAVVADIVTQPDRLDELEARGLSTKVSVTPDNNTPILIVTAESASPDTASATARALVDALVAELEQRQEDVGAPDDLFIQPYALLEPNRAEKLTTDRTRAGVAAGLIAAALAAYGVIRLDLYLTGRKRAAATEAPGAGKREPDSRLVPLGDRIRQAGS